MSGYFFNPRLTPEATACAEKFSIIGNRIALDISIDCSLNEIKVIEEERATELLARYKCGLPSTLNDQKRQEWIAKRKIIPRFAPETHWLCDIQPISPL